VPTALSNLTELASPEDKASSRPPLDPVHQAVVDERKADYGVGRPSKRPTRDAAIALQYKKLAGLQPHVFARIEKALLNEGDPLHEMVVEKLMMRVVPVAFWESLAKSEFREEAEKATPSVTIIVNGAAGAPVPTIDVVAKEVG
jgi:hypothetical protein